MNDYTLGRVLSDAYERTTKNAPREHPERTGYCPSIPEFARGVRNGWSEQKRSHISGCEYCQKLLAFHWAQNPPGLWSIAQFVAGDLPDKQAMQAYLDRDPKARSLTNSVVIRKLAALIQKLNGLSETIRMLPPELASGNWFGLDSAVFAGTRHTLTAAPLTREATLSRAHAWSETVALSMSADDSQDALAVSLPDGPLKITVSATHSEIKIDAICPGVENAARRVLVELLPEEGDPIQVTLRMLADTTNDIVHSNVVLPVEGSTNFLATCSLVAAWIA